LLEIGQLHGWPRWQEPARTWDRQWLRMATCPDCRRPVFACADCLEAGRLRFSCPYCGKRDQETVERDA
jgi:hypothetical protein